MFFLVSLKLHSAFSCLFFFIIIIFVFRYLYIFIHNCWDGDGIFTMFTLCITHTNVWFGWFNVVSLLYEPFLLWTLVTCTNFQQLWSSVRSLHIFYIIKYFLYVLFYPFICLLLMLLLFFWKMIRFNAKNGQKSYFFALAVGGVKSNRSFAFQIIQHIAKQVH